MDKVFHSCRSRGWTIDSRKTRQNDEPGKTYRGGGGLVRRRTSAAHLTRRARRIIYYYTGCASRIRHLMLSRVNVGNDDETRHDTTRIKYVLGEKKKWKKSSHTVVTRVCYEMLHVTYFANTHIQRLAHVRITRLRGSRYENRRTRGFIPARNRHGSLFLFFRQDLTPIRQYCVPWQSHRARVESLLRTTQILFSAWN